VPQNFWMNTSVVLAVPWHFIPNKEAISEAMFSTSYVS
jgi:hypothetical protein